MSASRLLPGVAAAALLAAAVRPAPSSAQAAPAYPAVDVARGESLLARVTGARDGTVRLTYALRPGVCGTGGNIRTRPGTRSSTGTGNVVVNQSRDVEWDEDCTPGPGRLALDVDHGRVTDVRAYVGGRWRAPGDRVVTDLGAASAPEVAAMLLAIAGRAEGKAARAAIMPATLADSVTVWPALLGIARDAQRPTETRRQATFWLSQAAGDAATRGLVELTDDPDRDVRLQAIFAISRRPRDEAVPMLLRIARTHHDPAMRRQAMFWLGRIEDPRALALFEELLAR